jgi:hypothetical protein
MKSEDQSIVFFKNKGWTKPLAQQWLKHHNLKPIKHVDEHLHGELRYRLNDPGKYKKFRTLKLGKDSGVDIVIGLY